MSRYLYEYMNTIEQEYPQAITQLQRITKRITLLERDCQVIEEQLQKLQQYKEKNTEKITQDTLRIHHETKKLKAELNMQINTMILLTKGLRESIKEEQFVQIKEVIENIPFHEYLTQRDLKRGV